MAQFTVNATRYDPYKTFMFRVKWDGQYVAGLSKMSALKRSTTPVVHRDGADPSRERKSPGVTKYEAVTLERGVTHDTAFEAWANLVHSVENPVALARFRKDLIVDVFNEAGQKVLSYTLERCWVSEFQALPAMDAANAAVAIESIKVELESWKRDTSVTEPAEA
ncbi:phage tail protein [Dactylosporangium roseum]|uniref:Phage tail protein n=1 Tax=Dactylosporangium roseum TaxID=47989 RepID=A0ABY5ZEG7_9ACTN|nr:phage tail protein [Dactylosporangium roseum]UWZ39147.1 phage tail protein [Dactylosporangium roseum]